MKINPDSWIPINPLTLLSEKNSGLLDENQLTESLEWGASSDFSSSARRFLNHGPFSWCLNLMTATSPLLIQSSSTVEADATPTPTAPSPTVPPSSSTSTYESVPSLPLVVDLSLPVEAASIVPPQPSLRHSQPPSQHPMLTRSRDGTRKARTFLATKDPVPQSFLSILSATTLG